MTKQELIASISELLDKARAIYEVADLKLERGDRDSLQNVHIYIAQAVNPLRQARREGRILMEEYDDNLTKIPKYSMEDMYTEIDEDEDEDEDE